MLYTGGAYLEFYVQELLTVYRMLCAEGNDVWRSICRIMCAGSDM
jgi:hypothetical protein